MDTKTAELVSENVSTFGPGTNHYRLSEPYDDTHDHVTVTVAGKYSQDLSTVVHAASESGAAIPEPTQMRLWVLHRALDRSHAEALADLGYTLVDDEADTTQ